MEARLFALLIGATQYQDPTFRQLSAPLSDIRELRSVLENEQVGPYAVETLQNQPAHKINLAIEDFFADRRIGDTLLLYLSGHGYKDDLGRLFFATTDSRQARMGATSVSSAFIREQMDRTRSRRVIVVLDCCYAGAFPAGSIHRAGEKIDVLDQLRISGRGRVVLTSSSRLELSFERNETGTTLIRRSKTPPSIFTSVLIEGLRTGEADLNSDGWIDIQEAYDYLYERVRMESTAQTPSMIGNIEGSLYLAKSVRPPEPVVSHEPDLPEPSVIRPTSRRFVPRRSRRRVALAGVALVSLCLTFLVDADSQPHSNVRLASGETTLADGLFPTLIGSAGLIRNLNSVAADDSTIVVGGGEVTGFDESPIMLTSSDQGTSWRLGTVTGIRGRSSQGAVDKVTGSKGLWAAIDREAERQGDGPGFKLWISPDGVSWRETDTSAAGAFAGTDRILDVVRTETGLLMTGEGVAPNGLATASAWTSGDGHRWTRIDTPNIGTPDVIAGLHRSAVRGGAVASLAAVPKNGKGLIVLRSPDGGQTWNRIATMLPDLPIRETAIGLSAGGYLLAARSEVYCSVDAANWTKCASLPAVQKGGRGAVALAYNRKTSSSALLFERTPGQAVILTSGDGKIWKENKKVSSLAGRLRSVAPVGTSTVLAVGEQWTSAGTDHRPLVWAADANSVREVALQPMLQVDNSRTTVVTIERGPETTLVATGSNGANGAIWQSRDGGAEWSPTQIPDRSPVGTQVISAVAYGPHAWLAIGTRRPTMTHTEPTLLRSDGRFDWVEIDYAQPKGSNMVLDAVAAGPNGYVAIGADNLKGRRIPLVLHSPDLDRVTYLDDSAMPRNGLASELRDVTADGIGFVVVGRLGGPPDSYGLAWTSPDGRNWHGKTPVLPDGAFSASLDHVVADRSAIFALGTATTAAGARLFSARSSNGGEGWDYSWLPGDATARVLDLKAIAGGYVAVGVTGDAGQEDGCYWTFSEKTGWIERTFSGSLLDGPGSQSMAALAVSGEKVLGIGLSVFGKENHLVRWNGLVGAGA